MMAAKSKREAKPPTVFVSDDGYVFYYVDGRWVDHLDPKQIDLAFDGDSKGPVDIFGERVDGKIIRSRGR